MFLREFFLYKTQNSSENSRPFWRLRFGKGSVIRQSSNGEGLRGIQHSMSMVLDTRFHIWFIMKLYYKMRQVVYYKMRQCYYKMRQLLQIATILLQNTTYIANCDSTMTIHKSYFLWHDMFTRTGVIIQ